MLLLALSFALGAGACGPSSDDTVIADAYYRYDPTISTYTVEVELGRTAGADSVITSYLPDGGVSFLGGNVDNDMNEATFNRFRREVESEFVEGAPITFEGLSAEPVELRATLPKQDSFTIDGHATHNFGLKVYSLDKADVLGANESLAALYQTDAGESFLAELPGPTNTPGLFQFPRKSVSAWPLSQGTVTFIRRRVSPIEAEGVRGTLTEEVYSRPQRSGMFN